MTKPVKWIEKTKALKFAGLRNTSSDATEEQLGKINVFTRRIFTAPELYVGQLWLYHNAIDRDNERFNEEILQHFNTTIVRKTFLLDHGKYNVGDKAIGKFFDSVIETVSLEEAKRITGEEIELPAGVTDVLFVAPWFYIAKEGVDPKTIVKIDAGVFDFASGGYRAERLVPITDPKGTVLYYEYQGRGEATEGSLVYLGAQPGAGIKSAGNDKADPTHEGDRPHKETEKPEGGKTTMNEFLKMYLKSLGKVITDGMTDAQAIDAIKVAMDERDGKIAALTTDLGKKDAKIAELAPLAADGKAFRDDLVGKYVTSKAKLGEVAETPEAQDKVKAVAATYPIDFLQSEVKSLEDRVFEKFPNEKELASDDRRDKSDDLARGEKSWRKKNPLADEE